jgi:antitoxin ParD1/3/4
MDASRTVVLTDEEAAYVDELVSNGAYASANEVLRAGVEALRRHERDLDRWIQDEIVSVADAMAEDPSRGIPIEQVFADLRARHAVRFSRNG